MNAYDLLKRPVLFLDFETSGLSATHDRAIEVAAIRLDGGGGRIELNDILRPDPVPVLSPEIIEKTGITQAMIEGGTPTDTVMSDLRGLVDGCLIIGHNVPFDIGFLNAEFRRHNIPEWRGDFICTRALATFLGKGMPGVNRGGYPYTSYKLEDVCTALGITLDGAHRALNDLGATEKVLLELWPLALKEHRPTINAMVRPDWVQRKIDQGLQPPEFTPPRAVVYLVA